MLSTDSGLARADRSPVSEPLGLGHNGTAHDLAGHGSRYLADMDGDLFRELGGLSNAIPEYDEGHDLLALDLIRLAYNGSLCDLGVRNGGGLDLLGRWRF